MSTLDQIPPSPAAPRHAAMQMPENHLDIVVTPGSLDHSRKASMRTVLSAVIALPLFFIVAFTLSYVSATHAPVPHDMAIAISGPPSVTTEVGNSLIGQAPGAFEVTRSTDAAAARDAVARREVVGAVIIDGKDVTTVVASAGGRLASPVVENVGQQVAASLGGTATVDDVAPLPGDDPGGTVLFFYLVICTIGGFLSITAISQVFPRARTRSLVATAVGAAVAAPLIGFCMISLFVDFGVTFGTAMGVIGIGMIYCFTVGMLSVLFTTVLGVASTFLEILILVALNFPSAGASVPGSMLPTFWQGVHGSWLGSGAFEAMRNIMFFDGNSVGRWIVQLLIWTVAAIVLTIGAAGWKKRRAATAAAVHPGANPDELRPADPSSTAVIVEAGGNNRPGATPVTASPTF